ncbi:hypothetical protein GTG23_07070 [Rhodococcus hoagii]|nr:hypothetical protein [Prescottella equi]NKZ63096.1 hypothetical protein [Prescottella equi]NKZ64023.1 hypothetical protein [Prescottella equi]
MATVSDIVEFLRARLDEDEQTATAATSATFGEDPTWTSKDDGTGPQTHGYVMADHTAVCGHDGDDVLLPVADHIARHDPARVLREVEAKRRILDLAGEISRSGAEFAEQDYRTVTRALAAVYSDHPDYQQEWAIG